MSRVTIFFLGADPFLTKKQKEDHAQTAHITGQWQHCNKFHLELPVICFTVVKVADMTRM